MFDEPVVTGCSGHDSGPMYAVLGLSACLSHYVDETVYVVGPAVRRYVCGFG